LGHISITSYCEISYHPLNISGFNPPRSPLFTNQKQATGPTTVSARMRKVRQELLKRGLGPYVCEPGDGGIHIGASQFCCAQPAIISHGEDGHEHLDPQVRPVQQRKANALDCEVELAHAAMVEVTEVSEHCQRLLPQNLGVDSTQLHAKKTRQRTDTFVPALRCHKYRHSQKHSNIYSSQSRLTHTKKPGMLQSALSLTSQVNNVRKPCRS
jgi:hypothetical protein